MRDQVAATTAVVDAEAQVVPLPTAALTPSERWAEPPRLAIERAPEVVLAEAQKAAQALKDVIDRKPRKVVLNGEHYLELEDWETLGRFYGLSARVVAGSVQPITVGPAQGWEAVAEIVHVPTGAIVSRADAMCLNDENTWRHKPQFQLRSMAQTRAAAKAFRLVLSWVVVLAGYRPVPAEELNGERPAAETHVSTAAEASDERGGRLMMLSETLPQAWPSTKLQAALKALGRYGDRVYTGFLQQLTEEHEKAHGPDCRHVSEEPADAEQAVDDPEVAGMDVEADDIPF